MTADTRIPVTVLTGYLGAGKTTLLNRILHEDHGRRWAVIVNEFGEIGIDHDLVTHSSDELFEMNNGCICCTVRGDLIRTLHMLLQRSDAGRGFDAIIVETTGLATPGPVAQTFFVDPKLRAALRLDSITTLVDARHVLQELRDSREAAEQIAFADLLVLNKTDLASEVEVQAVERALRLLNPTAPIEPAQRGNVPLERLLGRAAFDLQHVMALEPGFLAPAHVHDAHCGHGHVHDDACEHETQQPTGHGHDHDHDRDRDRDHDLGLNHLHDSGIHSVSLQSAQPMDAAKVQAWLAVLVAAQSANILRAKGIFHIAGEPRRMVFQSVHSLLEGDWQRPWHDGEPRGSRLVFIGRRLDASALQAGLDACAAAAASAASAA